MSTTIFAGGCLTGLSINLVSRLGCRVPVPSYLCYKHYVVSYAQLDAIRFVFAYHSLTVRGEGAVTLRGKGSGARHGELQGELSL